MGPLIRARVLIRMNTVYPEIGNIYWGVDVKHKKYGILKIKADWTDEIQNLAVLWGHNMSPVMYCSGICSTSLNLFN